MKKNLLKVSRLRWLAGISLLLLIFLFGNFRNKDIGKDTAQKKVEAPDKPNVLFIVWDGMQPSRIGSYGADYMHTPSLNGLSETGFTFEHAYVQQALCTPSRFSMLTGLRPDALRIYNNQTPLYRGNPGVKTFAKLFHENGYETIKTTGVAPHIEKNDKEWDKTVAVKGDWKGKGYLTRQAVQEMKAYHKQYPNAPEGKGPAWERGSVADSAYLDGKKAMAVIRELRRLKKENKSFLMAVGFTSTHLPFLAPQKYWDIYPADKVNLPDNFYLPENKTKYSVTSSGELRGYSNIPKGHQAVPLSTAKTLVRGYQAAISYDDALTGMILDELKTLGLDKNTIVVFWSDHGAKVGEHLGWAKQTNYETDTRVPLIVRVPWLKSSVGKMSGSLVESVDIYPSLAQLCKLKAPANLQGNSFVPLMEDANYPWKQAALSQYPRDGGRIMGYSMRTEKYRYTEWVQLSTGKVEARELYNHEMDPEENVNVAGEKGSYGSTIDSLSVLMHERWKLSLTPGGFSGLTPRSSIEP